MNVRTLCLAILYFGDATGYEIKKMSMEGKYSYFVDASFGSIYPALSRLEREGRVTCREETQTGKPSRKIYSITDSGREEFENALLEPPGRDVFRSEFLLVAMCADIVGPQAIRRAVDRRIEELEEEVAMIKKAVENASSPGSRWVCEYGIACTTSSLDYIKSRGDELEAIAASGAAARVAAE